ncbi:hypothetical protein M0802_012425 [Mischocyttarus mexicanus]|nr:hypothetical protein M0802_012425 [Mischocyttarus mexicanus]
MTRLFMRGEGPDEQHSLSPAPQYRLEFRENHTNGAIKFTPIVEALRFLGSEYRLNLVSKIQLTSFNPALIDTKPVPEPIQGSGIETDIDVKRKQPTHQTAVNPWTKAKDWSNIHNLQRNEGQVNPKSFFSTNNNGINNDNSVNFRPSNVNYNLDNYGNSQNVTSTNGMANLRELAYKIQELNKICNISKMLIVQ